MNTQMNLVRARVGLTNYYHQQVIRNTVMDLDSTIVDQLTEENLMGGVKGTTLNMAAVYSAGLNAQASDFANIQGNWNESKGLMMLDFITADSPVAIEYTHVIGYITNNGATQGLTADAVFTPVMSWKSHATTTASLDINNPTTTRNQIGGRTDYLMNDGSQASGMVSMRPSDIIDFSMERANADALREQMEDEGLPGMTPTVTVAGTDIDRMGVVSSKRNNLNPSSYAKDILSAGTGFQRNNQLSSNMVDAMGQNDNQFDGIYDQLVTIGYQASNKEPQLLRDDFFATMRDVTGQAQLRGFTGYSIGELAMAFENLEEVMDLTFMDSSQVMVSDFTMNTESMGTSQIEEYTSQEITMNIMDLMIKYGLSEISFRGSNCDHFGGDGNLSNVVILPFNPMSLSNDDFDMGNKVEAFVTELTNQIFAKLNGLRPGELTPIRFDVTAELFGTCIVNMVRVTAQNQGDGFNMQEGGVQEGMSTRVYPTYALNNFSPVMGSKVTAQQAGSNFFSNLQNYFS